MRTSQWTSPHGTKNVYTHNRTTHKRTKWVSNTDLKRGRTETLIVCVRYSFEIFLHTYRDYETKWKKRI
jgi:mRNA-degrading endonuclease HigB of HigAB toxin-antitoxin module